VRIATQSNRRQSAQLQTRRRRFEDLAPLDPKAGEKPMIAIRGLTRRYGQVAAVQELSFDVHAGTVVGFLGRNGAGKSTTLKILAGLSVATSGTASITGVPYRSLPRPMQVAGFGLNAEAFHASVSGERALRALGSRIGVGPGRVRQALALVELHSAAGGAVAS
jgi:ABC-2 type transport system ATP-binding protein